MLLSLSGLAEILDGPEGPQRGVEKGQEIGDDDIVEEKFAVSVGVLFAELVDEPFEGADVFGPDDWLGSDWPIARGPLHRSQAFGALGRWRGAR